MADLRLITGADDKLLGNLFMLLEGARQVDPTAEFAVCDFGFTPAARRFLDALGLLLPKPAFLEEFDHPWYAKAAMGDYVEAADPRTPGFVWIDADIMPIKPFARALDALAIDMVQGGVCWAVCPDVSGGALNDFIAEWAERGRDIAPFRPMLDRFGLDGRQPYLNTGVIVCTDMEAARRWRKLTLKQPVWLLFEQNSFNALAHRKPKKLRLLDTREWNAHGALLDGVALTDDDPTVLVHATSAGARHKDGPVSFSVRGKRLDLNLKLLLAPHLRDRQLHLLSRFVERTGPIMEETGLLTAP
ncbi:MAG: hypothetical protein QNJ84_08710 [Alphaproteobacteria bacterium]|nr:hypothetical protein [Alphaproteobacteria bacterium]